MSGKEVAGSRIRREDDGRRAGAANIVDRVLALRQAKRKGIIVVDCWEGAVANATAEERRALESAIFLES